MAVGTVSTSVLTDIAIPDNPLTYPLEEGPGEVTMWYAFANMVFGQWVNSITEFPGMAYAAEEDVCFRT